MANQKAQDKLIVVKHKPGIKRKRRLMFITGLVIMGAACFWLGEYQSRYLHQQALAKLETLSIDYSALKESDAKQRQQVANLQSGRTIDDLAKHFERIITTDSFPQKHHHPQLTVMPLTIEKQASFSLQH